MTVYDILTNCTLQFSSAVLCGQCTIKWRFTLHLTECLPLVVKYDTEKVQFYVDLGGLDPIPSNHCSSNPILLFYVIPTIKELNSKNALYAILVLIYCTVGSKTWCTWYLMAFYHLGFFKVILHVNINMFIMVMHLAEKVSWCKLMFN